MWWSCEIWLISFPTLPASTMCGLFSHIHNIYFCKCLFVYVSSRNPHISFGARKAWSLITNGQFFVLVALVFAMTFFFLERFSSIVLVFAITSCINRIIAFFPFFYEVIIHLRSALMKLFVIPWMDFRRGFPSTFYLIVCKVD